jgi:hypothetical protein
VRKGVLEEALGGAGNVGPVAARRVPPVTARPPVGTNMPMLKVVPEGAELIGMTGYALPPARTEVEM